MGRLCLAAAGGGDEDSFLASSFTGRPILVVNACQRPRNGL